MLQAFTGLLSRYVRTGMVVISLPVVLAACHKKPETPPEPAPVAAPAPKPSQPLPPRTPGLWETTIAEEGSADPAQIMKICMDAKADQHLGILGNDLSGDNCSKKTYKSAGADGATWELLAECQMGTGVVTEYSGSISGDYTQDYSFKVRSQTTGGSLPQMNRVTNYMVTSKRIGPCAKDQAPGDVISDGVTVNLFDMAGQSHKPAQTSAQPADVVD